MKIAEYLRVGDDRLARLMRQCGVDHAVLRLPEGPDGSMPVDVGAVGAAVDWVRSFGMTIEVLEPVPPMEKVKQGLPGRDEEIDRVHELLRTMAALQIPLLCYNFMAAFGWGRTRWAVQARGGSLVTGFDAADLTTLPPHPVTITEEQMWDNYAYFLRAVIPVAEETGVNLAVHPDDPPLSPYRNVARILRNPDAIARAMGLSDSPAHGLTFCQGTFATMGAHIPTTIQRFADRIRFVHFRDIQGRPANFVESWHDDGRTDMAAAMRTYAKIGFTGPMRSDHVPTLDGEDNQRPGYETLGRLYAVGYMRGLWQSAVSAT